MVTAWGMSQRLGPVAYRTSEEHPFLGKEIYEQREFSEHSAQLIDEEVAGILHAAAARASELLGQHRTELNTLATALEKQEVLDEQEIEELLGPSINKRSAESNGRVVDVVPSDNQGGDVKPAAQANT
jgi:cell division protease FtsH